MRRRVHGLAAPAPLVAALVLALGGCAPDLATECDSDSDCPVGTCHTGICLGSAVDAPPDGGSSPDATGTGGAPATDALPTGGRRADAEGMGGHRTDAGAAPDAHDGLTEAGPPPADAAPIPCVPEAERCNGADDDCNGVVDDVPPEPCYDGPAGTEGVGSCRGGLRACANGQPVCGGQLAPEPERCDGQDNDCNGAVDDLAGPAPAPGSLPCELPHAAGVCVNGACVFQGCLPGYFDVDAVPANGCERGCGPPIEGRPVGGAQLRTAESPAVAAALDGATAVAFAPALPGEPPDGRLVLGVGDGPLRRPGMADATWRSPAIAAWPGGFVVVGRRTLMFESLGYLGLDPQGEALGRGIEGGLPVGANMGRPVVAVTGPAEAPVFMAAATAAGDEGVRVYTYCGGLDSMDAPHPGPVDLAAGSALPAAVPFGDAFALAYIAAGGVELRVLLLQADCTVRAAVSVPLPTAPSGLGAAAAVGDRPERLLVAATDAAHLVLVTLDLPANGNDLRATVTEDLAREGLESTPAVFATRQGFWALYVAAGTPQARGRAISVDGRSVTQPVPLLEAPPGLQVERLRAAPHPQGAATAWILTPDGTTGQAGEVRTGVLTCD